ncbi:MAG: CVNH domain-containing protein [Pseudanabaena sp. ELA607]|jgi:hypothetical protein
MNLKLHWLAVYALPAAITFNLPDSNAWGMMKLSRTCQNISISGSILTASCERNNGTYKDSRINLNPYIGNSDGRLIWDDQNFASTCNDMTLSGRSILSAKCLTNAYFRIFSFIDLDDRIVNIDGSLRFQS